MLDFLIMKLVDVIRICKGDYETETEKKKREEKKNEDNYYDEPHSTPLHTIIVFIIIRKRMRMPSLYFEHNELY